MKGIVIIPTFRRPGFLEVCLEHIQAARGWKDYNYLFAIDRNDKTCDGVMRRFYDAGARGAYTARPIHNFKGNVFNIMSAYQVAHSLAIDAGAPFIHLIEDDIFIAPDYFDFHEKAWQTVGESAFCVSACRNQNRDASGILEGYGPVDVIGKYPHEKAKAGNPSQKMAHIYLHQSYQSLGVSFRTESVRLITEHARPEYWVNPIQYCREAFPDITAIPAGNAEQAGLIHRIIHRHNLRTAYPVVPRAYHAGFAGSNRPGRKPASEYTAQEIRKMTAEAMNGEAKGRADIQQCEMVFRDVEKTVLI